MVAVPKRRRFTVAEYYQMADARILTEDDRVELIKGEVIQMPTIGVGHASIVNRLTQLFVVTFGESAVVTVQNPLRVGARSEPVPDLLLLKPRSDFYRERHPMPEDVLLLVEVSDTTLRYDRDVKLPLYAQSGVPEVWIVDLNADVVHTHSRPGVSEYRDAQIKRRGERLVPLAFLDQELAIDDILG